MQAPPPPAPVPDSTAAAHQIARRRSRIFALGLLALFALGFAGLAAAADWRAMLSHLAVLGPGQVALLLALSLVNYGTRGLRWHVFVRALGPVTTLAQDMRHFLAGLAMTVTPGRLGELVRLRWLCRETGFALERVAPLPLADRAADLAAMAALLAFATALSASGIAAALPVAALGLAAAWAATRPRLLAGLVGGLWRAAGRRAPRLFARARHAARAVGRLSGRGPVLAALALGLAGWLAEGVALWLLLDWLGTGIGLWTAVAIFTFSTLAGGLTGAPGGIGGAEAAMIALLQLQGVPLEVSIPATAVFRLVTFWFAVALGLALFPAAERAAARALPSRRPSV